MGNNPVRAVFKRTNSKRFSQKRPKGQPANLEIDKTMDESNTITHLRTEEKESTNKGMYSQNLEKYILLLEEKIDYFVKAAHTQKEKIDGVLQRLKENTSENVEETSQEEIIRRQSEAIKNAVDSLDDIQWPSTDSFTDVRNDIERCLKEFGKDDTATGGPYNIPEKMQKHTDDCCDAKRKQVEEVEHLKQNEAKLENANKDLHFQNKIPESKLEQAAGKESVTVQLFYIYESDVFKEIEKELKIMLKNKLGTVNFLNCPSATDIDQEKMLIVLCIVSTRLSADAENAIKDIQNPANASLLIIHNTEAHSLPNQISSRHLTDQGFRNLRSIVDMSFKSGNGFFQCDMNERSINELCSFCKQSPFGERL